MLNLCMPILDYKPRRKSITVHIGHYITSQHRKYDTGASFWRKWHDVYKECYNYWRFDFKKGKYVYTSWRGRWDDNVMRARFHDMTQNWKTILIDDEPVLLSKFSSTSDWLQTTGYDGKGTWKCHTYNQHYTPSGYYYDVPAWGFPGVLHGRMQWDYIPTYDEFDKLDKRFIAKSNSDFWGGWRRYNNLSDIDSQYNGPLRDFQSYYPSYTERDSRCDGCSRWWGSSLLIHYEPLN